MYKETYHKLASALDKLPNGFPRTESGVEIEILKRIFNPNEAEIASLLTKEYGIQQRDSPQSKA